MIRILIVDDQKSARETIKRLLETDSDIIVVGFAHDGYEAVMLAATLNPDIILMDIQMPNLDGLAATKLISQQNSEISIILLSIYERENLLVEALNAGAKGCLFKDIVDSQEIINTIHLIHEGNPFVKLNSNKAEELHSFENNQDYKYRDAIAGVADSPETFPNELYLEKINERRKFDFSALLVILKRRYLPGLMGFSGVLLGAILYLIFAQRNYQATASISLENSQESISEIGKNLSSMVGSNEYSPLASQAQLIKSKPVLNDALENIAQEKADYSINDNFIRQIKDISPAAIQKNLDVKVIPNTNILEVNYVNPDPELASLLLNEIINAVIAKNTDIIRSEASSVRQFLEKEVSKQRNELSQIETSENRYREQKGIVAVDNQTANLVNSLNNLETQEQNLLTQIKEQETKVNNLKQIAKVKDAESAYIEGKIGQDPQLERLRSQLTDVEAELAAARSNFTDNNPTVIALLEKREKIFNLYQKQVGSVLGEGAARSPSEVRVPTNGTSQTSNGLGQEVFTQLITTQTQLKADRDKLQAIQAAKGKLENQIALLPAKVQSLTELVRQKTQADESLKFLQRNLEEARIAEAQLVSNVKVVEEASIPSSPQSPKTPVVLAIASVIGTILAVSIILLLEKIDSTLYDGTETERQLNIPFLTALPNLSDATINLREIKSFLNNRDLYEPYRSLLKKLESRLKNRLTVIVVTSATSQEGKSVVASHLGALSATLSKRTLIIDAHLRLPEQYRLFDVKLAPGLREIVTESLNLAQVVQPTEIRNLSVLTSGISTENSFTILESPMIKNILQQAAIQYDLVIIDAPPVNNSCDAYTLSKYSDGLVMVTRPFHTNKKLLEQAVEDLKRNKASIIGFAINRANNQKSMLESDRDDIKRKLLLLPSSSQTNNSHQGTKEVSQP